MFGKGKTKAAVEPAPERASLVPVTIPRPPVGVAAELVDEAAVKAFCDAVEAELEPLGKQPAWVHGSADLDEETAHLLERVLLGNARDWQAKAANSRSA